MEMIPGSVINIPAGVKHWHGAAADSWFSHLAIEVPGEETANEWCEPVSEQEYAGLKLYAKHSDKNCDRYKFCWRNGGNVA